MRVSSFKQTVVALAAGASTVLAAASSSRRFLGLQNIGASDATLAFDAAAVAGQGWLLPAGGGGFSWDGLTVPANEVRAVAAAATTVVVWEG